MANYEFPDFFYLKQSHALNGLHAISIEFLGRFNNKNNPTNAYDSEWGQKKLDGLEVRMKSCALDAQTIERLLRQRVQPTGFIKRPELDRDILRIEHIVQNIEHEQASVSSKRLEMLAWVNAAAWMIVLTALFWYVVL